MVALNYQKQFAEAVETGRKPHSVRGVRKGKGQNPRRGGMLQHYTGMRTKQCRKLREGPCESVRPIIIASDGVYLGDPCEVITDVYDMARGEFRDIMFERMSEAETKAFAAADGFQTVDDFIRFFAETHGLPFTGQAIFWEPQP